MQNINQIIINFMAIILACFTSCRSGHNVPETVKEVDLNRYSGKWYEIASFPARFQKGCKCTAAEYTLNENKNYVEVVNTCLRNNGRSGIKGKAYVVKGSNNTKLKVQFFWPFKGDYWIFELADDYSWAAVGSPQRNYLWILSRTKNIDDVIYKKILEKLINKGFNVSLLVKTEQNCE